MTPKKLRELFIGISLLGVILILGFSYLSMSSALQAYNIENAQRISKNVGFVLYQLEKNSLIDEKTNQLKLQLSNQQLLEIDNRIRELLKPLNVVKIKIFSLDTRIIYSSEHSLIGKINDDNDSLKSAIKGLVSSDMKTRDEFVDLQYESRFDVDVVETYLPMFDEN